MAHSSRFLRTDRKSQAITYAYDAANRLTSKTYPDNTSVTYTYDLANHLTQVVDPTGTYGFTFDGDGRLMQTTTAYTLLTGKTFTIGYGYDAAANRTSMTDPQNAGTTYVYDTLNRLSSLTSPQGAFGFSYDALSRRTQLTRPNNVTTTYGYDPLSRLLSVLHKLGTATLDGATYTVDNAGNRTSKTDQQAGVTTNYAYDNIYQLLSATQGANTTESYTYDAVGNRLSDLTTSGWSNNTSNELTSRPGVTYTYDNNGNELTKADSTGTTTYTWDFENRLTSVSLPGSGGSVTFKYDPFGRRIQKSSSSTTTNFLYDGPNSLEEVDGTGTVLARYTQTQNTDEPLAMLRSGVTSFYHADGLGSITSLTNSSGATAQTYAFDSFGNQTTSSGSLTNPFQYTAREFDSETNLYFYRARYYLPASGRFLTEDPTGFAAGANFYIYAQNAPTLMVDPSGRDTVVIITRDTIAGMNVGDHSAVRIDSTGNISSPGPVLYDPSGSYGGDTRGRGGYFLGAQADLDAYVAYQEGTGSRVYTYRFKTTPEEKAQIAKRIDLLGDPRGLSCALSVSAAIQGIGPFKNITSTRWPGKLASQLAQAKDDFFLEEQLRIIQDRLMPKPPILYYTH